jgi:hypothetical protein
MEKHIYDGFVFNLMVKKTTVLLEDRIWRAAKDKSLDLGINLRQYIENLIVEDNEQKFAHQKGVTK